MKMENRQLLNDDDKVVATLTNRNTVKFEPGMVGPYKKRVEALLTELGIVPDTSAGDDEQDNGNENGNQEEPQEKQPKQEKAKPKKTADVAAIPDSALPPWNKVQGFKTPGFGEWIKKHNLTTEEIGALVRRLEKR